MSANASPVAAVDSTVTGNLPTVSTKTVFQVTDTTARCGGIVLSNGGSSIMARGVCWSTSQNPTTADSHTVNGTSTGTFFSNIQGLTPGQTYYVRAYATNMTGTAYGEQQEFITTCTPRVTWDTLKISPTQLPYTYGGNHVIDTDAQDSTGHTFYYLSTEGCDSVANVFLVFSSIQATACNEYVWAATGQTYYASGTYIHPYTDAQGHLLGDTLHLTIITPTVSVASIPPVTVCENQTVNFSANATGSGNVALDWSGPSNFSGSNSNVQMPNASLDMSGVYTVTATTIEGGCMATASATVTVTVNPLPEVHISGDAVICQNESVTLTASGAENYQWNTGSTGASITETPTSSQTYTVVGTDENQCQNSASVSVTVNELPEVTISGDGHICDGEIAQLTASGAKTYQWSTGSNGNSINVEPTVTTTYTVEGTDENNCSNTASFTVKVNEGGDDTVYVSACESYYWPVSGQTYTVSGTYIFNYSNNNGCLSYHTLILTITHDETHTSSVIKCESYTWDANGETYTESGTYTHSHVTPLGCYVTDVLYLSINHGFHEEETDSGCENYLWAANGEFYNESGTYTFEYTNMFGCPSTKTLHLTIKHGQDDDVYETDRHTYTWPVNGETYTESGDHVYYYLNEEGCLSTITLHLTLTEQLVNPTNCIMFVDGQDETCDPGNDGSAALIIPDAIRNDCKIEWKLNNRTVYDQLTVNDLPEGTYSVKVKSIKCESKNVVYFSHTFKIKRTHDCDLKVRIQGPTFVQVGCDDLPSVTFHAIASGGAPPYVYEGWSGDQKTVTISEGVSIIHCTVRDRNGNKGSATLKVVGKKMDCSNDPNEITGPVGYNDTLHYVNATDKMNYTIDFENDPDFATAPASRVKVTYDVPENQNIASFRLADFGFGSHIFTVPTNISSYSQRLDVSDSLGVWVDVTAGIDIASHQLFWIFQSIDPATGFEPSSSQMGFLPINDSLGHGEGYVNFYILPDGGVQTGDTVGAEALIVFDDNAPIGTNVWRNTFDAVAPSSTLHAELDAQDSLYCTFSFTAQDDQGGSGVRSVETFVSVNNGAYSSIGSCHPDSTLSYALENGLYYQFMSLATDNVGNTEPFKNAADTAVNYNVAPFDLLLDGTTFYEYRPVNTYIGSFTTLDDDINQHFVYELVSGEGSSDNNLFTIVNNELKTNSLFECSHRTEYDIRVRSTDIGGLSIERTFTLNEIITHETPVTYLNAQICQGESYGFHGQNLTATGTYSDTLNSADGCDSIVTLFLTVNPTYDISIFQEVCQGDSYLFNSETLTEPGIYIDTLQTVSGCDSIVTLTLTVNPVYNTPITAEICQGESYNFHGSILTESGIYIDTLRTVHRCDSIVTLTLTVNPVYNTSIATEICDGDSYNFFGQALTTAGTYTHTLQTVSGCDSIVTLTLTVNPSYHATYEVDILCQGERFLLGGQYLTESGVYVDSAQTVNGCDSITTLILTVNPVDTVDFTATACNAYVWNNITYSHSGDFTQVLTNQYGCDSIVTLHLTVFNSNTTEFTETACDSYTWGNETYTQSGDHVQTFTNANGCDSTVTLHLTVLYSTHNVVNETACEAFTWHGTTYTTSGTYTYAYTNADGCASADTLHLTVNYGSHNAETESVCESFTWHDTTYTTSGTYLYEYTNADGCASVDTLHLTVNYGTHNVETETVCDSFTWHGTTYTTSGTYTYAYTNADGCPSVDTLHLTVLYGTHNVETETACETFTWHGTTYTTSGTYTYAYTNADGCASVDTLHLTVNYGTHNVDTETACESFVWHGTTYTTSGTYTYAYTNAEGCASEDTLHLTVNFGTHNAVTETACESFTWHGTAYTTSGTYLYEYTNADGCPSVDTLYLTVLYGTHNVETETACESFTWHGTTYTTSGTYTYAYTNVDGCASADTLHLTVNYGTHNVETETACETFTWHGQTYTESGTYVYDYTNASGCVSADTLYLTVLSTVTELVEATACDSYTWNGSTYTASGEYIQTFTGANGCDSVVTLDLTIHYSTVSDFEITTTDSCYEWNTQVYCETGDYVQTLQTADGCDSVVTLHLTITVGIDDYDGFDLKVYPNPTSGIVNVQCTMNNVQFGEMELQVFDAYGRLLDVVETLRSTSLQTDARGSSVQTQIDLSRYANGIYFVKAVADGETIAVRKVVKE